MPTGTEPMEEFDSLEGAMMAHADRTKARGTQVIGKRVSERLDAPIAWLVYDEGWSPYD